MQAILTQMQDYATNVANQRANVTSAAPVEAIKLEELAKNAGFEFFATTKTAEDGTVSSTMIDYGQAVAMNLLPVQTLQEIYGSTPMEFSPAETGLVDRTMNLYWITEVKPETLPEFEESKDLALSLWKRQEAIALAETAAKEFAEKVKAEGKTLAEADQAAGESKTFLFAKTEPFSGFDFPRGFRTPNLTFGEIREEGVAFGQAELQNKVIVAPGKDFYTAVYDLNQGEIAVVRNQPEDRVFVIQLTEEDSDDSILEKMAGFQEDQLGQQALSTLRQLRNVEFQEKWIQQLEKEVGFEWVVIPRNPR